MTFQTGPQPLVSSISVFKSGLTCYAKISVRLPASSAQRRQNIKISTEIIFISASAINISGLYKDRGSDRPKSKSPSPMSLSSVDDAHVRSEVRLNAAHAIKPQLTFELKTLRSCRYKELIPKAHDISNVSTHIPSFSDLTADLEAATRAVRSQRHESRYSKVYALFLRWTSDDLGVVTESNDLQVVFQDLYHYQVESYKIPDERPDTALKRRLLKFLEKDAEDTLLIIYYAGHAKTHQSDTAPVWHA